MTARVMTRLTGRAPLLGAAFALWAAVFLIAGRSMADLHGHLGYELDDTYIHMAIARNLAEHGVWGVTPYGFTASSSSLLWSILLAAVYRIIGISELAPLVLSLAFATASIAMADALLRRHGVSGGAAALVLLMFVFFTPLPALVLSGLEHTLHLALSIAFIAGAARQLAEDAGTGRASPASRVLLVLAPLLVMSRFEGLFLVFAAGALFAVRRRLTYAVALVSFGSLPVVLFGVISVAKGWLFLPNSVLMKANRPPSFSPSGLVQYALGFSFRDDAGLRMIVKHAEIGVLTAAALGVFFLIYARRRTLWRAVPLMLLLYVVSLFLHTQFARVGPFYRYEAYLVGLGVLMVAVGIGECWPRGSRGEPIAAAPAFAATAVLGLAVTGALFGRAKQSLEFAPRAMANIYQQQYQMGLFLKESYQGRSVAANDIGAISLLSDIHLLDLWGLASMDVARAKKDKTYSSTVMRALAAAHDVDIAIVSEAWFKDYGGVPKEWVRVGSWTIPNNVVCADSTVTFFAVRPGETAPLVEHLEQFGPRLPPGVSWGISSR